jgi:hypothetical protein
LHNGKIVAELSMEWQPAFTSPPALSFVTGSGLASTAGFDGSAKVWFELEME